MRLLMAVALVAGCALEGDRPIPQPINGEVWPRDAEAATDAAVAAWGEYISAPGARPTVRWFAGECLDYGVPSAACVTGTTQSVAGHTEIHVAARPRISGSSLAHEILHWLHVESGIAGDSNHEMWHWDHVSDVNSEIRLEGF